MSPQWHPAARQAGPLPVRQRDGLRRLLRHAQVWVCRLRPARHQVGVVVYFVVLLYSVLLY